MAIRLTDKRRAWAAPRDAQLKGEPLKYPIAPAVRYEKSLDVLIREMRADYQRELLKLYRSFAEDRGIAMDGAMTMDASIASQARILFSYLSNKWAQRFAQRSKAITDRMLGSVDKAAKSSLNDSLKKISGGITIKIPALTAELAESMKAAAAENVALIRNIQSQYAERIEGVVYRSIQQGGRGAADIYDEVIKIGGMSERRANLIATDQTRKATTALNVGRAKAVGIKKGIWRHSAGSSEDPRKKHLDFDGKEFDLNDPPAIGDRGQKVLPGQDVNCRCFWTPVVDFDSL